MSTLNQGPGRRRGSSERRVVCVIVEIFSSGAEGAWHGSRGRRRGHHARYNQLEGEEKERKQGDGVTSAVNMRGMVARSRVCATSTWKSQSRNSCLIVPSIRRTGNADEARGLGGGC
jgi:hypothetical protein